MFKGLGDFGKMMGQMQQLQEKMAELQQKVEQMEVEGSAGGGMVVARVSGKGVLKGVDIDPSLLKPEDKPVLEDLLVAAVADAQEKASRKAQEEMQSLTAGLPIPPGMFGAH